MTLASIECDEEQLNILSITLLAHFSENRYILSTFHAAAGHRLSF